MHLTPGEIHSTSMRLEYAQPEEALAWAFDAFRDNIVTGTGFGLSGVALMHMLAKIQPKAVVFYLDTDLLFPETYALKNKLEERLDIEIVRIHPGLSLQEQTRWEGETLWRSDPDRCCFLRKVQPLRRFLASKDAWITGIRRDQALTRRNTAIVEWDETHNLVKINPMASWTETKVREYIRRHDLPYNPLHDEGYPSIGCMPCTKPVKNGQDIRSGRWQGHEKTECGIHLYIPDRKATGS